MSTNALQGIVLLLGLFQFALASFVLYLDPRRPTNVVLALYQFVFAVFSVGVIGMTGASTVEEAAPWTWLVALAGLQVGIGLIYLTVHLFRPDWLKRVYVALPLAVLSMVPIVLVLIDGLFHTQLMYGGLDARSYTGGYVEPAALLTTPLGVFFRQTNLIVLQFGEVVLLLYLLRQRDLKERRSALIILLILEVLGVLAQLVLRPVVGATVTFALIQFALTTGVALAVSQAGALSTQRLSLLLQFFNPRHRSFSVRAKLLVVVVAVIVIIVGVQAGISLDNISQQNQASDRRRLIQLYEDYRAMVSDRAAAAAALSASLADRADIPPLLKAGDRAGLLELLTPTFNDLKTHYNVTHLNVVGPDGIVVARIQQPDQFGDSIIYRQTAAQALTTRQTVSGPEVDRERLGMHGVSPVLAGDELVGLVEIGLDFDQAAIDILRNRTGTDYRFWMSYQAVAAAGLQPPGNAPAAPIDDLFFYGSTTGQAPTLPAEQYRRVLSSGRLESGTVRADDQEWAVLLAPIQAYPDRTIGAIEVIGSHTALLTSFRQSQTTIIALAVGLGLLAITLVWLSTSISVLSPLRHLTTVARRQIEGDLQVRAAVESNDEFGQLGDTLNALTGQLSESIGSLERRVADRTQQLQASAEVGRAAASILDTDELLRTIVNLIADRFGFYYVAVFTLDESQQWARLREATGEAGRVLKERQHRLETGGQSMVGAAIKARRARIALDTGKEAVRFANPLLPDTRSEIALPLVVGDRVLGALDVQATQAAAFDETNADVLQAMTDQIAIAVSNAGQFRQTEAALQNTRNLFAASQDMSAATDIDSLLRTLINHITPDASRAGIALFGPRDETGQPIYFEFAATWVQADFAAMTQLVRPGTRFTPQQLPVVSSVTPAQPLVVPDASADEVSPALRTLMHRFGAEAMTALALVAGQNPLGILIVGYRQARTFSADYVQTLLTLGGQAAIVIQNQRSLAEAQAALKQLDVINRRLTGEAWQAYTTPLGGAVTVRDVAPGAQSAATPAALSASIVVRGEPIGALKLQDADPDRAWSANDRSLLEAVANEVAVAIDNARLLEQTERRAQREQFIAEVSRKMLAASNMQSIIQIAGDELSHALQVNRTEVTVGLTDLAPASHSPLQSETSARS